MAQIMHQWIHTDSRYIGIAYEIKLGSEIGAGIAAFPESIHEVMQQRILARAPHIPIALQVPARVEERVRLVAAQITFLQIVLGRRAAAFGDVRIESATAAKLHQDDEGVYVANKALRRLAITIRVIRLFPLEMAHRHAD
jgi:hypothetical protein